MRQFLVESLLLAAAGGVASIGVTYWVARGLLALASTDSLGGWLTASVDLRLLAFTFAISLLTGLLFGLAPALSATRPDVAPALKDSAASVTRGHLGLRRFLVAAQVALSLVLLIGAGVFARSLANLLHYNLGFRPERLLVFSINPALSGYRGADTAAFVDRIRTRLSPVPGVVSVAASQMTPLSNSDAFANVTVEGYRAAEDENTDCQVTAISPGYFRTLGVPLIAGREFTAGDDARASKVAIVNQAFVDHFFPGRNPLGRRMTPGSGTVKPDIEIVGVVGNTRQDSVREKQNARFFYLPYAQQQSDIRRMSIPGAERPRRPGAPEPGAWDRARNGRQYSRAQDAIHANAGGTDAISGSADRLAGGRFRSAGHAAGLGGTLRRDRLHRVAADGGDRHPHGARRDARAVSRGWCCARWR